MSVKMRLISGKKSRICPPDSISDDLLDKIFSFLENESRSAIAQVCRRFRDRERQSRRHITVNYAYSITPSYLLDRFPRLESIKIKGKPRADDFELVPTDWGGYAAPWIECFATAHDRFSSLSCFHFKRMEVTDADLMLLAKVFGSTLQILKLVKCSGFSSDGLEIIASACRNLKVLSLAESNVLDGGCEWLHHLGKFCSKLEVLNFSMTPLALGGSQCTEPLVFSNCRALRSLKLSAIECCESLDLRQCPSLVKFGYCGAAANKFKFPPTLTSFTGDIHSHLSADEVNTLGANLRALNLLNSDANHEQHIEIIRGCPNLEDFRARDIIGDVGLKLVATTCKQLRKIRIENMLRQEEHGLTISNDGLLSLATTCINLQSCSVYVQDVTNSALEAFATFCPNLVDFRLCILENSPDPDSKETLDQGVKSLLQGCNKITKLALYLKEGRLTDKGLASIGSLGKNLKWALLGCLGDSDTGLISFAAGCPNLRKLEVRNCPFTEAGIAFGIQAMKILRYAWFQGYKQVDPTPFTRLSAEWKVELIPGWSTVFAYRSVNPGNRSDYPASVVPV